LSLDYTTHADEAYTYDANGNRVGSGVVIEAYRVPRALPVLLRPASCSYCLSNLGEFRDYEQELF
jgi:hypothetical protein